MTSSFLKSELEKYKRSRPKSAALWKIAKEVLPGGISHSIRTFGQHLIGNFPIYIKSSYGPYVVDIDEIKYLDCWIGHFANILGHNPPEVRKEIKEFLDNGWHFGTVTEYQIKLAQTLIEDNKSIEQVRFCTSGTEATMYATRLARAYTNKKVIAKARLGWHGANDTLYYFVGQINGQIPPPGLVKADEANIIPYEINTEEIFEIINKHKNSLAAIILEPVLGGGGGFPANIEYLKRLREETEKYGIILIFDEVITGYRFHYGFYQDILGVLPDLTTMGKIVGGGMPMGGIGGRRDIIERSSPFAENQILIGGGTFSGFPLSMLAGLKTLEILKKSRDEYQRINKEGEDLRNNLNQFFNDEKVPIFAQGQKSMVMLHTLSKWLENPNMRELSEHADANREALLHLSMFNRNIVGLHGLGAFSMAHKKEHFDYIKEKVIEVGPQIATS